MTELVAALQEFLGQVGVGCVGRLLEEATLSMQVLTEIDPSRQIGAERYARAPGGDVPQPLPGREV